MPRVVLFEALVLLEDQRVSFREKKLVSFKYLTWVINEKELQNHTLLVFISLNLAIAVQLTITLLKKNLFSSSTYMPTPI